MRIVLRPRMTLLALMSVPVALLISEPLARIAMGVFFILLIANLTSFALSRWIARKDEPAREARLKVALSRKPAFVAYGSGAPKWLAVPIYVTFIAAALALILWEAIFGPPTLKGFNGFLTAMMYSMALPLACLAAHGIWMALAWRLRDRYRDKVLVFANAEGIGTADGWVIPYAEISRIDPCSSRSRYGVDNWIEIQPRGSPTAIKVHLNMARDSLDDILVQMRDRARAGGADLAPALANGLPPSGGTQLGYRMGYLSGD